MLHRYEASLLDPVASYVRRKSFRWQETELPFYEYRIDLYGFSRVGDITVAVELKLNKWRRAHEQALLYQLCADLVFVALPIGAVHRANHEMFCRYGIGLIAVSDVPRCVQIIPARQSPVVRTHYRNAYVQMLMGASL